MCPHNTFHLHKSCSRVHDGLMSPHLTRLETEMSWGVTSDQWPVRGVWLMVNVFPRTCELMGQCHAGQAFLSWSAIKLTIMTTIIRAQDVRCKYEEGYQTQFCQVTEDWDWPGRVNRPIKPAASSCRDVATAGCLSVGSWTQHRGLIISLIVSGHR